MTDPSGGFALNRIVALITPLIAALSGLIVAWTAERLPGVQLDPAELTALIASVVTSVLGVALKWLDGWQKHESRLAAARAGDGDLRPASRAIRAELHR